MRMLPLRMFLLASSPFLLTSDSYVPVHLEYILTEILKNSFRATVEHYYRQGKLSPMPPVVITLAPPSQKVSSDADDFFSIRIRDQGGGVSATDMSRIFSYAFTTAGRNAEGQEMLVDESEGGPYAAQQVGGSAAVGTGESNLFGEITGKGLQTGIGTIAGLGYGLPMSRLYAKLVLIVRRWHCGLSDMPVQILWRILGLDLAGRMGQRCLSEGNHRIVSQHIMF